MPKTIITAALTGTFGPEGYQIPKTPEEIAEEAYEVWKLGASIVHLHMRDENGVGVMDPERFAQTVKLIRAHRDCDVIINCTSSGGKTASDEIRMAHFKSLPGIEMGSYDAGTFNWLPDGIFVNSPQFLQNLGDLYIEKNIKPEIEIFEIGHLNAVEHFYKSGHLPSPFHFQFVLGVKGAMQATVDNLVELVSRIPAGSTWSAFGIGKGHMPILFASIAMGGHVRVGMEDNVIFGKDERGNRIKATNAMLVSRAADCIRRFGNQPATPAEAREILGIPALDGESIRHLLGV